MVFIKKYCKRLFCMLYYCKKEVDKVNDRIRLLRKYLGLSQTEFGAKLGIKQTTVAGYETGGRTPIDAVVSLICREFGVSEEWLCTGDGDMFVQLSRDEEIADFVGSVIGDEDAIFKRRFISMLSKLNESQWELLEQMVNKLKED